MRPITRSEASVPALFRQHLLDAAQGLAGALFVFDEGEADVAVAVVAEADAGAYGYFGFGQQQL